MLLQEEESVMCRDRHTGKVPNDDRGREHQELTATISFPGGSDDKESACNAGDLGLTPGLGRVPWRREWLPIPVFLPGESHGQRGLAGYSP